MFSTIFCLQNHKKVDERNIMEGNDGGQNSVHTQLPGMYIVWCFWPPALNSEVKLKEYTE